jgi:methionyl-tRNA synthetase
MTEWYCYKDKVKMVDSQVSLKYMQMVQDIPGFKCPECGTAYLTEKVVRTVVRSLEELFEEK